MSAGADPSAEKWPASLPSRVPRLSLAVGRGLGTVVVTVDGEVDLAGCELLEAVLMDLIEGQGDLAVVVDLGEAAVEPEALMVFVAVAKHARRQGTKFLLKEPPTDTREALQTGGFGELMEVVPRRTSRG